MPQPARRDRGQPLGELDRRTMREPGKHGVLEFRQLRADCGIDRRMAMAEQIDPPGTHRVEISTSVEVVEPRSACARERDQRQRFMLLHLRARMPNRGAAAREPQVVGGRHEPGGYTGNSWRNGTQSPWHYTGQGEEDRR